MLHQKWGSTRSVPSQADFDKKLAETDAYLQLLIDQVKVRDVGLFSCFSDDGFQKELGLGVKVLQGREKVILI